MSWSFLYHLSQFPGLMTNYGDVNLSFGCSPIPVRVIAIFHLVSSVLGHNTDACSRFLKSFPPALPLKVEFRFIRAQHFFLSNQTLERNRAPRLLN